MHEEKENLAYPIMDAESKITWKGALSPTNTFRKGATMAITTPTICKEHQEKKKLAC